MIPRAPRYPSLDFWRGVACLVVVVFHSCFYLEDDGATARVLSHFWLGVPLFFVISGYCISATADSTRRKGGGMFDYFRRRLRRIFPPYWACLALTVGLVSLAGALGAGWLFEAPHPIPDNSPLTPIKWLGNLTLTESWRPHVAGSSTAWYLGQAWSLAFEEQFYAVCGLLLLLCPRRFFAGAAVVTLLTLALAGLHFSSSRVNLLGFFVDGHWLLFAAGVAVYYQLNYAGPWSNRILTLVLAAGFLAAVVVLAWPQATAGAARPIELFAEEGVTAFAFALLLPMLRPYDELLTHGWLARPVVWCGTMCYSLYLVHWPVVKVVSHSLHAVGVRGLGPTLLVTVPACATAALLASRLFYWLVERRFLNPPQTLAVKIVPELAAPAVPATSLAPLTCAEPSRTSVAL